MCQINVQKLLIGKEAHEKSSHQQEGLRAGILEYKRITSQRPKVSRTTSWRVLPSSCISHKRTLEYVQNKRWITPTWSRDQVQHPASPCNFANCTLVEIDRVSYRFCQQKKSWQWSEERLTVKSDQCSLVNIEEILLTSQLQGTVHSTEIFTGVELLSSHATTKYTFSSQVS